MSGASLSAFRSSCHFETYRSVFCVPFFFGPKHGMEYSSLEYKQKEEGSQLRIAFWRFSCLRREVHHCSDMGEMHHGSNKQSGLFWPRNRSEDTAQRSAGVSAPRRGLYR